MSAGSAIRVNYAIKRCLDILFSLLLLMMVSPFFLLITLLVRLERPGPVFFRQRRLGRYGRQFELLKFSTVRRPPTADDLNGNHIALNGSDSDISWLGHFLRTSGLNELPQLLNILRGEMSFVGPRPAVLSHEQYYTEWHRRRLEIPPGVTGLAQVCGRNAIPWGWRVALDRYYVEHCNLLLDFQILIKTVYVILGRIGTEGETSFYTDFTPPAHDIVAELQKQGVMRFNPDATLG